LISFNWTRLDVELHLNLACLGETQRDREYGAGDERGADLHEHQVKAARLQHDTSACGDGKTAFYGTHTHDATVHIHGVDLNFARDGCRR